MDTIKIGEGQEFDRLGRVEGRLIAHLADPNGFGWMLVSLDEYEGCEDEKVEEFSLEDFLNDDGKCFSGDDEFNAWIENLSRKHPYCCICKKCSEMAN